MNYQQSKNITYPCQFSFTTNLCNDSAININTRSLTSQHHAVFHVINKWTIDVLKYLSTNLRKIMEAGVGKSHLIETTYISLSKLLLYKATYKSRTFKNFVINSNRSSSNNFKWCKHRCVFRRWYRYRFINITNDSLAKRTSVELTLRK